MGKDFLKRWRTGCCHLPSAPSLSNWQCCLLQISSLQKHQTFPSSSFWRNKLCCSEAAEEYVIISCFSFLPSLVHRSRMVHAHCLSHLGLFIYAGAHTASCSRASAHPTWDPVRWRKTGIKFQAFIYSEYNFARVACVIRHGWWGCNIAREPVNLWRPRLKKFMFCYTTGYRGTGCGDFVAIFVGGESEIYNF